MQKVKDQEKTAAQTRIEGARKIKLQEEAAGQAKRERTSKAEAFQMVAEEQNAFANKSKN